MGTVRSADDGVALSGAAPTLGLVLAGTALAATFLPWGAASPVVPVDAVDGSALAAGLALLATAAFALRRYGLLDRWPGSVVAAVGCFGVLGVAIYRLVSPAIAGVTPDIGLGLPVAALAALAGLCIAVADWLALTDDALWAKVRGFGAATVVGFVGFVVSNVVALLIGSFGSPFGRNVAFSLSTIGAGIGLVLFTVGYVRFREFEWSYIDVTWPTRRDAAYALGGLVLLLGLLGITGYALQQLGIPSATSGIEKEAENMANPVFLLALVPLSFLAIAPGEELVYRNVVQKYLYESFSRPAAVVMASLSFGAVHFQQYAAPNPVATITTLCVVFALSLVLGWTYYRTENLLVPMFIHGAFNAIQFAGLYIRITGGQGLPGLGN